MCSNYSKTIFLESPDYGDTFGYLYHGEKIQIDNFKRIFSKKNVEKRSGPLFGPFKGGGVPGMSPYRPVKKIHILTKRFPKKFQSSLCIKGLQSCQPSKFFLHQN